MNNLDYLRQMLAPGARVLVLVTRVNPEGTARWMHVVASVDGQPMDITAPVARLLTAKTDKVGAMHISGAGMDMRFHVVYELGHALYSDGYSLSMV